MRNGKGEMATRLGVGARAWKIDWVGDTHLDDFGSLLVDAHMLVLVQRLNLLVAQLVGGVLDVWRVKLELWVLDRRHGD